MVPVIAGSGRSFHGAWLYYFHDKNALTSARVVWTHTLNLLTDCAAKAWKVMAFTAKSQDRLKEATGQSRAGRKLEKPVFTYSLSWHPEQKPDKDTMLEAARLSLEKLGLSEHETMIAAHNDEPQPHCHIIVNRCHPLTGVAAKLSHSKRKLSDFAREWEHKEGKIYCMQREENHQKRQKGQATKYVNPIIADAWENSRDAEGFKAELKENGYDLARGRKRLVVIDPYGKIINPIRHLREARAKDFHKRMAGIDPASLPTPDEILAKRDARQQAKDNALRRYEERVSEAINQQMTRHHEQWVKLSDHHRQIIERGRAELSEYYKLDESENRIERLRRKLDKQGLVQKFANKVFRRDRAIAKRIERLQASRDNARQRLEEAVGKLEKERDTQLQILEHSQDEDRKHLAARLAKWKPHQERSARRSVQAHDHSHERQNTGPARRR